ncbi:MAG: hypothetical protein JXA89_19655 [Anaerolineae bacterium]|nr:hypothetical protein [Anaerolineae bacterium]
MIKQPGLVVLILATYLLVGCVFSRSPFTPSVEPTPTAVRAVTATSTTTIVPTRTPTTAADIVSTPTPTSAPSGPTPFWDWQDLTPYKQAMLPEFQSDVDRFADATRYIIDLRVDPQALTLHATEYVRYTNHEIDPLSDIVFRLIPNTPGFGGATQIQTILLNGQEASFDLQFQNSAIYVPLQEPLSPGKTVDLVLSFEGTLPADALSGYAPYGYFDRVLALPTAYAMIPVYDDEGWNAELAPIHGDPTFSDTALYLVRLTLPKEFVVAASGVAIEEDNNDDGTTTRTFASGPMRDFNVIASPAYVQVSDVVGQILVTSYYMPGDDTGGKLALDYAVKALRLYQEMFGPYPFNELDVMATPTEAGGIEYPGLIVIARHLYDREGGFFEFVTAHEMAHQWWYSLVGNDQIDEPWLDEALAQYATLLYFEHYDGQEVARSVLKDSFEGWYKSLNQEDQKIAIGLPTVSYPEPIYGAIVYGKGPLFFHEIRSQVGDDTFYAILQRYLKQYQYGIAYPQDWMDIAEELSGQNLDELYQEWVVGEQ